MFGAVEVPHPFASSSLRHTRDFFRSEPLNRLVVHDLALTAGVVETASWMGFRNAGLGWCPVSALLLPI
jgi:hypothetical protein